MDLELGKPTQATEQMHFSVLGNTDPALAAALREPAPTITVTAEALEYRSPYNHQPTTEAIL